MARQDLHTATVCKDECCENETQSEPIDSEIHKEYTVTGMDCGDCARTIQKGVSQISGIQEAQVNFSTGKLHVAADNVQALQSIPKTVTQLGYQVATDEPPMDLFKIEGMDCGNCALTIQKHLAQLPEVQDVAVNFASGTMEIQHTNSVATIEQELKKIGYGGHLDTSAATTPEKKKTMNPATRNLILSAIALAIGVIFSLAHLSFWSNFFFAITMIISGAHPARSAFYALKSKSLDMNVLMISATVGAAAIQQWREGALVVFLFAIGNLLQIKAVEKTRNSIQGLLDLTPATAFVKKGTTFVEKPVSELDLEDILLVKPGARVPLDGVVTKGDSSIDQAPITGESIPVNKTVDDPVFAGTINQDGALEIRITKRTEDSTIARIVDMVAEAQEKKAPSEAFIDRFAKIYTPVVFVLALLVMIVPPLFLQADFSTWFYRGLELLVIACPCALIISTPVSIVSAIGNGAKNGVLIKGGNALEKLNELNAIAFDKTGTITKGTPQVASVQGFKTSETKVLQILATLETHTSHPIGKAIVAAANAQQLQILESSDFQNIPGKGLTAKIKDTIYFAGTSNLFANSIITPAQQAMLQEKQSSGESIVLLGTANKIIGLISVADQIRETSKTAITKLHEIGVQETIMLTGDNNGAAQKIAKEAGITGIRANLLPDEKVKAIETLQETGSKVGMVGDGINDAPALALADVGIAMGGAGTDTAIETADVVLMADNLEKLPFTVALSNRAMRIIKQNVTFALVIKFIALLLIFPGWLTLWLAVLSDSGAAVLVTLNALRLLHQKKN